MNRMYLVFSAIGLLAFPAQAGVITRTYTYTTGNTITANENNTNENTLYNEINGNLDTDNIENGGIGTSDLADSAVTFVKMDPTMIPTFSSATITRINSTTVVATTATITGLVGTTTNDSAYTGNIGEYKKGQNTGSQNFPTSNQYGDCTSVSLTAGDWDVWGAVACENSTATPTLYAVGISQTSGNSSSGLVISENLIRLGVNNTNTETTQATVSVGPSRVSIAATTTVYLKFLATYPSGQPIAGSCTIQARRAR